eukprot:TRINITY_DN2562_c0_g1_i2.p1 TRINITY_DN2562_c0_g1~~TRINITY_DN2562_c0_g1_i2.p1  ORF type:complete len:240 (-),score=21.48 TRINITY_DN2562_c0_g1_i2:268-987(-)
MDPALNDAAVIIMYTYLTAYYFCFLIALLRLLQIIATSRKGWDVKRTVHGMIPGGLLLRALWFTVLVYEYRRNKKILLIAPLPDQTVLSIIIGSLPGYWSFSNYTLVCLFWFYLFNGAYSQTESAYSTIKKVFASINIFVYGVWITLMGLVIGCTCRDTAHSSEAGFVSALNFVIGVVFAFFLVKLYGFSPPIHTLASAKHMLIRKRVCFFFFFYILLAFVCALLNIFTKNNNKIYNKR